MSARRCVSPGGPKTSPPIGAHTSVRSYRVIIALMLLALFQTMRPKQWTKNFFVYAALVFDHKLFDPIAFAHTSLGFGLLCMAASAIYLINDLVDIEKDRQHPKKRLRPLPAGRLNVRVAQATAALLLLVAVPAALALEWRFGVSVLVYLIANLLYSFHLKHIVLIDVLLLASFYLLRAAAGAFIINVNISPWLYICMSLLALFLGFGKRRGELLLMQNGAAAGGASRRVLEHYTLGFLDELINIVSTATIVAYSLYTFSADSLPGNHAMMLTIPFVLYGLFRYLYLIHIKGEGGAPDELILTDRPLQITFGLWAVSAVAILYFPK